MWWPPADRRSPSTSNGFFADNYRVELFDTADAAAPSRTVSARQASLDVRPVGDEQEVWARVAVVDGADGGGAWSDRFRLSLPRPGRLVLDLARQNPRVTNSPDTAFRPIIVGGVSQPSLFEHPSIKEITWATAEFTGQLPSVTAGRRLLFVADLGLKDGATLSDGVRFAVSGNGRDRFEQLVKPDGAWHAVEVDLTDLAGQALSLVLKVHPNAHSAADWAAWAEPRVLLVGPGVVDLPTVVGITALGKEVRGRVTLRWQEKTSDGRLWPQLAGFSGYRVYRGADRGFQPGAANRLGESKTSQFVDATFDGRETYYRVTAAMADGSESPPSEAVQYAP
ncbi:MAG: NPCBM/NEW2 domain-containing protein [Armatimonadetes bacterium]|nr:NPCBM/NEW2 domain-containing protein [Armatimonadota bacterium]